MTGPEKTRATLDRALSRLGLASRAQAAQAIRAGQVTVNGRRVLDPGRWVDLAHDSIRVGGAPLRAAPSRWLAFHKPTGVITTRSDERGRRTVLDFFPAALGHLSPAGRLDKETSGLLIVTNDNALVDHLTSPRAELAKTYEATVRGAVTESDLERLRGGIELSDGRTRPAQARLVSAGRGASVIHLTIHEGRNRQVRRMADAIGHPVLALARVAIGGLALGNLAVGRWRVLSRAEVRKAFGYHPAGQG